MIVPCSFNFHFPDISNVEHLFMDVGHLHVIFGKIFIGCHFLLLIFLFLCRRLLVWWSSICLFVLYLAFAFNFKSKKPSPRPKSRSLWVFIVSVISFKSLIHFELNIVYSIWYDFILLHVPVQFFFRTIYWIDCPFLTIYFWLCCHKLIDHICMSLFLGSLSSSIDLCVYFWSNNILFWLLQLCNNNLNHGKRCLWLVGSTLR